MNVELLEEKVILKNLLTNEDYFTKVMPYLSADLFEENTTRKFLFQDINNYYIKFNSQPNITTIATVYGQRAGLTEVSLSEASEFFDFCKETEDYNLDWLVSQSEKFVSHKKYLNAISESIEKIEKSEVDESLPEKLQNALATRFDPRIGMAFTDAEERWKLYTEKEDRIQFNIDKLNEVTNGGLTRKTLNCLMSSNTGGFKSGSLCSFTCDYLRQGYNVLYLSFEMAENKVMERIDANLLDTPINDLTAMGKERFVTAVQRLAQKTFGRLVVKQYPTSLCHVGHIRNLLNDLKNIQSFIPDVIIFDYLGIMASQRYKKGEAEHIVLKATCEEVRGLCVEYNVLGWTAMQSNRSGASAGESLSLADISASYGTAFGFDLVWGLITTPEFDEDCKIRIRQLKSRYGDINKQGETAFFLGINKGKMKLFEYLEPNSEAFANASEEAQKDTLERDKRKFDNAFNATTKNKQLAKLKANTISNAAKEETMDSYFKEEEVQKKDDCDWDFT